MKHSHTHSPSDGRDLRRNVLALRRVEGEIGVSASGVVGAKRHLRIGSSSPSPSPLGMGQGQEGGGALSFEIGGEDGRESLLGKMVRSDDGGVARDGGERGGEPMTPKKAVGALRSGVGSGAVAGAGAGARVPWGTPGSLYDRDGFLKGED